MNGNGLKENLNELADISNCDCEKIQTMKIQVLYIALVCSIGVIAANELVPWTTSTNIITKISYNVPYKIDAEAKFSDPTMRYIKNYTNNTRKNKSGIIYKEVENETIYLFITSFERCLQDRMNNIIRPNTVIVICLDGPTGNFNKATKMAMELNRLTFHPETKSHNDEESTEE